MPVKQKPEFDVVERAARLIKDPQSATPTDIKRMASHILNDEKNAPRPNRTVPKPRSSSVEKKIRSLYPKTPH